MSTETLIQQVRDMEAGSTRLCQEVQRLSKESEGRAGALRHARAHLIAARESIRDGRPASDTLEVIDLGLEWKP